MDGQRADARLFGDSRIERVAVGLSPAGADLQRDRRFRHRPPRRRECSRPAASSRSAEPAITLQIFLAGQPMLMSMIWSAALDVVARRVAIIRIGAGDLHRDRFHLAVVVGAPLRLRPFMLP